jgi:Tfp pilus assembly protein PilF/TolB-like protein
MIPGMNDPNEAPAAPTREKPVDVDSADERDRWSRVKAVFVAALDRPALERDSFLETTCAGDAELLAEVMSLLASERAAGSFGETPAAGLLQPELAADGEESYRLRPGQRIGVYEVSAFLSAGGMGEVYRARHTLLGREVAIKTVASASADPDASRRLVREARHASVLSHPNVCTIHEVGEWDGTPFIVMALVDGPPLKQRVQAGPLPLDLALDYGVQVAAALEHAHEHGIVHRDLKSSNVVVDRNGRAVVLDFGLAKRLDPIPEGQTLDASLTLGGALAGTLSHMAPEVLLGHGADRRSDIWSLGVLLYELVTGGLPFEGQTPFETGSAILGESPRPFPAGMPLALRWLIGRCLTKEPDARFQNAADVRRTLEGVRRRRHWQVAVRLLLSLRRRTLATSIAVVLVLAGIVAGGPFLRHRLNAGPPPGVSALAFLPFDTVGDDEEVTIYAAGFTEALVSQLGAATDLRLVAPASGALAAPGGGLAGAATVIGSELGADALVAGRLRRSADRIAVDVHLVETRRGRVLWSDTFERPPHQALVLQADVVRAIAAETRLSLRPGSGERLATARTVNPEAYEAFLKGRYEWNQRTQASLERAVAHFSRAVELDRTYAPAHAALADCYNQFGTVMLGTGSPAEFRPRAAEAAIRALQIDPFSAEAHAALAYVRHYQWQWDEAEQGFRRAIELNPSYALARIWYANLLMSRGRFDEALEQAHAALALDPYSLVVHTNIGWILIAAGRPEEAIPRLQHALAIDSTYPQARMRLVDALIDTHRLADAMAHAHKLVDLTGDWPPALLGLAGASAAAGDTAAARALLHDVLHRHGGSYIAPWSLAAVHLRLGEIDRAVDWYGRALEEQSNAIVYVSTDPDAGPLQRHPRFQTIVAQAGLAGTSP